MNPDADADEGGWKEHTRYAQNVGMQPLFPLADFFSYLLSSLYSKHLLNWMTPNFLGCVSSTICDIHRALVLNVAKMMENVFLSPTYLNWGLHCI